jgi:hypothetical protein
VNYRPEKDCLRVAFIYSTQYKENIESFKKIFNPIAEQKIASIFKQF